MRKRCLFSMGILLALYLNACLKRERTGAAAMEAQR